MSQEHASRACVHPALPRRSPVWSVRWGRIWRLSLSASCKVLNLVGRNGHPVQEGRDAPCRAAGRCQGGCGQDEAVCLQVVTLSLTMRLSPWGRAGSEGAVGSVLGSSQTGLHATSWGHAGTCGASCLHRREGRGFAKERGAAGFSSLGMPGRADVSLSCGGGCDSSVRTGQAAGQSRRAVLAVQAVPRVCGQPELMPSACLQVDVLET